tara:strand:- start:6081 stop:6818 length:738 start_codon:yes stop_codon:yes gene_type:complete
MNSKPALILSLLITLLVASNFYLFNSLESDRESVLVARVIDGDTLVLEDSRKIRLVNINAPEKSDLNSELATLFLKAYENKTIEIEPLETDKYGRLLARAYSADSYLNLELIENGYVSKFLVQPSELSLFDDAQSRAIEKSRGIWIKSPDFGCIETTIEKEEEFVILQNLCSSLETKGWVLKDESTKRYKFPSLSFSSLILYSSSGQDDKTQLHWGHKNVWNNDRDSLYLFDQEGKLLAYESYGY